MRHITAALTASANFGFFFWMKGMTVGLGMWRGGSEQSGGFDWDKQIDGARESTA